MGVLPIDARKEKNISSCEFNKAQEVEERLTLKVKLPATLEKKGQRDFSAGRAKTRRGQQRTAN